MSGRQLGLKDTETGSTRSLTDRLRAEVRAQVSWAWPTAVQPHPDSQTDRPPLLPGGGAWNMQSQGSGGAVSGPRGARQKGLWDVQLGRPRGAAGTQVWSWAGSRAQRLVGDEDIGETALACGVGMETRAGLAQAMERPQGTPLRVKKWGAVAGGRVGPASGPEVPPSTAGSHTGCVLCTGGATPPEARSGLSLGPETRG